MAYRNYGPANGFIVSKDGNGDFSTIASALTASTSGTTIFIKPGTYTENPTLKAGVNLTAFGSDSSQNNTGKVIISGNCTLSSAGSVTISGIQLQTNSGALLTVSGSSASIVNLENCFLNYSNTTGISFSASNTSAAINIENCNGDLGTTGISFYSMSSTGVMKIKWCQFTNTGGSSTASTNSAGTVTIDQCRFLSPISNSSTGVTNINYTNVDCTALNVTAFTTAGSGTSNFFHSRAAGGTASAISVGSGTTLLSTHSSMSSSNTNCITGAGTFDYNTLGFTGTSSLINVTTQTGGISQGGTFQAPSAGFIGEQLRSAVTGVGIGANTASNLTSLSLTPGIWDVTGIADCIYSNGVGSYIILAISANSASITGTVQGDSRVTTTFGSFSFAELNATIPAFRITLTATTTYYLVIQVNFSAGTATAAGRISATRVG